MFRAAEKNVKRGRNVCLIRCLLPDVAVLAVQEPGEGRPVQTVAEAVSGGEEEPAADDGGAAHGDRLESWVEGKIKI